MEESVIHELILLKNIIQDIIKEESIIQKNIKCFVEVEIIEFLLEIFKWSPKIKILLTNFINLAKKFGKFTIISLGFCINCLLETKNVN